MKKLFLFLLAAACVGQLFAQGPDRKGYIGICLGPAFPAGDIDNSAISGGAQLNLVNFGYLISNHVGIAATWYGTSFVSKGNSDNSIGLGGIMLGPLFSVAANQNYKVEFDFKPMIGFGRGTAMYDRSTTSSSTAVALGLGATARWNCGGRISLSAGVDYYYSKPDQVNLSSVGVVFGINYRLR